MLLLLKELPELVAKLQHEVDPCAIQEDGSRVTKDDDEPALVSIIVFVNTNICKY